MTIVDDRTLLLEARSAVYSLLSGLFLAPPAETMLTAMRSEAFTAEWPLSRSNADVEAGLTLLRSALPGVTPESLREEFWHLFGTLGPAAAPPWQSVYLDRERVAFGEETLRVARLFAQYGFQFSMTGRHPDDHIGLELEFMAHLSARTAERLTLGDKEGAKAALIGQWTCLGDHLMRWVEPFVNRVEAASPSHFYGGLARLTLGILRADQNWLREQVGA